MQRRFVILAAPTAALVACAPGSPASSPAAGSVTPLGAAGKSGTALTGAASAANVPELQLPTAAAPRADSRLTLIWFRDFE